MGEIVDLDAFRKQREEEEKARVEAEAEAQRIKDQADIDYMQELLDRIMVNLSEVFTGSYSSYNTKDGYYPYDTYQSYSSDDYMFTTYVHEAGYDDDGYYERSWELEPFNNDESDDEPDF